MDGAYARLEGRNSEFLMTKRRIFIGRNSKLGDVDVSMGNSRFISRKHLEISLDRNCFFILCRGKNGVFVDDIFQRRENKRLQLPSSCMIRFPSTQIKLAFTSLLEDLGAPHDSSSSEHPTMPPLKIDAQLTSPFVSPMPSPTGTISAVTSCPTSPNSGYRHRMPSFDFMAKYASKLLSSQQQQQQQAPDTESANGANNTGASPDDEEGGGGRADEDAPADEEANNKHDGGEAGSHEEGKGKEKSTLKPPYSYAQLIVQGLLDSRDRRQTLSNIYNFIAEKYPYYKLEDKGWKNSIRHNLSLNQYFMKAPREKEGLGFGKGGYWCMHPDYEEKLTSQAYVKRKKKGIPVFPSAGLITRSAPPSPTHHPFLNSDLSFKEVVETKFTMPTPPTTSHFTLPPFFSQMAAAAAASSSSHSLPASPSRPPTGFSATPLKFFPMGVRTSSSSAATDALALENPRKTKCDTIREEREEPIFKKPRLEDAAKQREHISTMDRLEGRGLTSIPPPPPPHPPMASLPPVVPVSLQQSVQFLPISLVNSVPHPPQTLLTQPLSSFLPQNFFAPGAASLAVSSRQTTRPESSAQNEG